MNYKKIYDSIIQKAQNRNIQLDYFELHHILPKCLGGTDISSNIVKLTAREHYLCHYLLAKHYNIKKLWAAFAMMSSVSTKHQRIYTSRQFEAMRVARTKAFSGTGNGMYGKPSAFKDKKHTNKSKEKIRLAKLGKKRTPFKRSPATEETKQKISKTKKGVPSKRKGIPANKIECPYCNKIIGGEGNYRRYHGDKCKKKAVQESIRI